MTKTIIPGITLDGFRRAVKDYKTPAVVEEMAANSFDADASTCLVLLDPNNNHLYIIDDGTGFLENDINFAVVIGGGSKAETPGYSNSSRPYLGSYGFGLKSTLNIANKFFLRTSSKDGSFSTEVDWLKLEDKLKNQSGYTVKNLRHNPKDGFGSFFKLTLKSPMSKSDLDNFGKVLANLPVDGGNFKSYFGLINDIGNVDINTLKFSELSKITSNLFEKNKIKRPEVALEKDLANAGEYNHNDDANEATVKYWFGGVSDGRIKPIKPGLRGIYIKIHGRLLKHVFTESKYTYNISRYKKFESGLRVEISADWLRDQITLARDGLIFSNEKLEKDFVKMIQKNVSKIIQPRLKQMDKVKRRRRDKQLDQRIELAQKRVKNTSDILIQNLKFSGFSYKPESDAELALIVSQREIMDKINKSYSLIDYNDQASFDCLIYDASRADFIYTELEPHLTSFLEHKNRDKISLIIVWDKEKWRVGAGKGGKGAYFKLVKKDNDNTAGHYRLLEYPTPKSKKVRTAYDVIVVKDVLET